MAKRYIDTDNWKQTWYRELGSQGRDVYHYLMENCDHAGVWFIDLPLISFSVGFPVSLDFIKKTFNKKYLIFDSDSKLYITDFISIQYSELGESSIHRSILKKLNKYGLTQISVHPAVTLPSPCRHPAVTLKEEEEEEDKEEDKDIAKAKVIEKEEEKEKAKEKAERVNFIYELKANHPAGRYLK